MVHDYYGNSCPDRGNVMAARLGRGKILYKWSRCSKEELMTFRLSGGTHCLQEDTPGAISLPPLPSTIAAHTIDYQCKKSRGEQATRCPFAIRGAPVSWYKRMSALWLLVQEYICVHLRTTLIYIYIIFKHCKKELHALQ